MNRKLLSTIIIAALVLSVVYARLGALEARSNTGRCECIKEESVIKCKCSDGLYTFQLSNKRNVTNNRCTTKEFYLPNLNETVRVNVCKPEELRAVHVCIMSAILTPNVTYAKKVLDGCINAVKVAWGLR